MKTSNVEQLQACAERNAVELRKLSARMRACRVPMGQAAGLVELIAADLERGFAGPPVDDIDAEVSFGAPPAAAAASDPESGIYLGLNPNDQGPPPAAIPMAEAADVKRPPKKSR